MRRSRVPIAEKRVLGSKTNHKSSQRNAMPSDQKKNEKKFFSAHGQHKKRKGKRDENKR